MKKQDKNYLNIHVDIHNKRIFFPLEGSRDAELQYKLDVESKPTLIEFTCTFVPERFRNQGLGSQLVKKGIRLAKASKYQIIASCPFVEKCINNKPVINQKELAFAQVLV